MVPPLHGVVVGTGDLNDEGNSEQIDERVQVRKERQEDSGTAPPGAGRGRQTLRWRGDPRTGGPGACWESALWGR